MRSKHLVMATIPFISGKRPCSGRQGFGLGPKAACASGCNITVLIRQRREERSNGSLGS